MDKFLYVWIRHKLVNVWLLWELARASEFMLFSKRQPNLKARMTTQIDLAVGHYRVRFDKNRAKFDTSWTEDLDFNFV